MARTEAVKHAWMPSHISAKDRSSGDVLTIPTLKQACLCRNRARGSILPLALSMAGLFAMACSSSDTVVAARPRSAHELHHRPGMGDSSAWFGHIGECSLRNILISAILQMRFGEGRMALETTTLSTAATASWLAGHQ